MILQSLKNLNLATFTIFIPKAIQIYMYIFYTNIYVQHWDLIPKCNGVLIFFFARQSDDAYICGWNM
jgi:hypothetical protein